MAELGNTLSRTRRARGITLEDAERDTHVSRRYLAALESEDFSVFPAPVYARGFLRTYSRYLGLNPEELLRIFPSGELTVDILPLPSVSRPAQQVINVNWLVAGLVVIFLLGAGMLLLRGGGDPAATSLPQASQTSAVSGGSLLTPQGAAATGTQTAQGRAIGPIRPGQLPDFVGADLASTLTVLRDNQMNYVIVEAAHRSVAKGIVYSQTPTAGAKSDSGTTVTLYVSRGPTGSN